MGLDMYFWAERVCEPSFTKEKDEFTDQLKDSFAGKILGKFPPQSVTYEIGYWRKANAIHSWFVEKCQGGVDECQRAYVPWGSLMELKASCKEVLADRSKADELLPTQSGFFFGDTSYDVNYFDDILHTVKVIEELEASLKDADQITEHGTPNMNWVFYYQSSW